MIGKTIQQYEIIEQLGQGGMGIVYKARDTKLDRIVALKFLPAAVSSDPKTKERFMQEARAASALDDPYICTIHDIAEAEDGQLFIVMAFYDGDTLKYVIDEGGLDTESAASIARQMALGLSAAHEAGIVHRDVKPANVMVTEKGRVKLLDFGVAKLGEGSDLTREGSTIGTASYMSPEQARGESVDNRSDIWSIGAVLYEMLAGKRAFGGGYEAAVAYSIINEDPPPLSGVSEELETIVKRSLSKNPVDRFQSAFELAEALGPLSGASAVQTSTRPAYSATSEPEEAPSVQGTVVKFVSGAAVVLAVLYGAMLGFGLPGWVFPAGVLLTLAGLPIVLYATSLDRQRASMDSGERRKMDGLASWLTTKRAWQGGLLAGAGLVATVLMFAVLKSAGIGPFATLITDGTLSRQDAVIVAEFDNQTSDATLGITVTEAFKIDLSQSSAIRLLDRSQVISGLERMQEDPESSLTRDLALRLAEREGIKAIIEGDINAAGASFILNARILDATNGSQLAAFRQNARTDSDILDAIDRLSADLREEIGESLIDIRDSEPLEQVTTSNTAALRLFTDAEKDSEMGRIGDAIEKLEEVIEMDSTFAMGYRKLGVLYQNSGEPSEKIEAIIEKGYRFKENLPIKERLQLEAFYQNVVEDDEEEEARLYEEILRRYPYDVTSLNNLAILYRIESRWAEAVELARRAMEVEQDWRFHSNLVTALYGAREVEEAQAAWQDFEASQSNPFRSAWFRLYMAFDEGDLDIAWAWLDSMETRSSGFFAEERTISDQRDNLLMALGRVAEGRQNHIDMSTIQRNRRDWAAFEADGRRSRHADSLGMELDLEWERALLTGDDGKLEQAYERMMSEMGGIEGLPEDEHGPFWIGAALATTGNIDEAVKWRNRHEEYHAAHPEDDNGPWPRMIDAFIDAQSGVSSVDESIRIMEDAAKEAGCAINGCFYNLIGDLEARRGNVEAAIGHYETYVDSRGFFDLNWDEGQNAVYSFRLGTFQEQQGNLDEAIRRYQHMVDRWENADAVLQPQVAEAKRRIETLLDRKAREN